MPELSVQTPCGPRKRRQAWHERAFGARHRRVLSIPQPRQSLSATLPDVVAKLVDAYTTGAQHPDFIKLMNDRGFTLMAIGGALSLSDRRYRVAAGARKTPMQGVPAE